MRSLVECMEPLCLDGPLAGVDSMPLTKLGSLTALPGKQASCGVRRNLCPTGSLSEIPLGGLRATHPKSRRGAIIPDAAFVKKSHWHGMVTSQGLLRHIVKVAWCYLSQHTDLGPWSCVRGGRKEMCRVVIDYLYAWFLTAVSAGENVSFLGDFYRARPAIEAWVSDVVTRIVLFPHEFFRDVKRFTFDCRARWMKEEISSFTNLHLAHRKLVVPNWLVRKANHLRHFGQRLLQWSFLGRALPRPPAELFPDAVTEQQHRLSTPRPVTQGSLDSFSKFVRKFPYVLPKCDISLESPASCLEKSRREGGRRAAYSEMRTEDGSYDAYKYRHFLWENTPFDVRSSSVLVPEYGWKMRIVSRSSARRVAASETFRSHIIANLNKFRCIRLPYKGEESLLPIRPAGNFTFSADLSNATDLLSCSLLDRLAREWDIPVELITRGTINDCVIECGTLMGIPLSFPALNVVHLWFVLRVVKAPSTSFYIKGDDLLARWTRRLVGSYNRGLGPCTGMTPNHRKGFLTTNRGLFCEKAYRYVEGSGFRIDRNFVSVRGLIPKAHPDTPGLPVELSPLEYLRGQYARLGHKRSRFLARLSSIKVYNDAGRYLAVGRDPYLPVGLGGLSLIPERRNRRFDSQTSLFLQRLAIGDDSARDFFSRSVSAGFPQGTHEFFVSRTMSSLPDLGVSSEPQSMTESSMLASLYSSANDFASYMGLPHAGQVRYKTWLSRRLKEPVTPYPGEVNEPQRFSDIFLSKFHSHIVRQSRVFLEWFAQALPEQLRKDVSPYLLWPDIYSPLVGFYGIKPPEGRLLSAARAFALRGSPVQRDSAEDMLSVVCRRGPRPVVDEQYQPVVETFPDEFTLW
jgi:hypothetical protein